MGGAAAGPVNASPRDAELPAATASERVNIVDTRTEAHRLGARPLTACACVRVVSSVVSLSDFLGATAGRWAPSPAPPWASRSLARSVVHLTPSDQTHTDAERDTSDMSQLSPAQHQQMLLEQQMQQMAAATAAMAAAAGGQGGPAMYPFHHPGSMSVSNGVYPHAAHPHGMPFAVPMPNGMFFPQASMLTDVARQFLGMDDPSRGINVSCHQVSPRRAVHLRYRSTR